jgi:hypothetical protein
MVSGIRLGDEDLLKKVRWSANEETVTVTLSDGVRIWRGSGESATALGQKNVKLELRKRNAKACLERAVPQWPTTLTPAGPALSTRTLSWTWGHKTAEMELPVQGSLELEELSGADLLAGRRCFFAELLTVHQVMAQARSSIMGTEKTIGEACKEADALRM